MERSGLAKHWTAARQSAMEYRNRTVVPPGSKARTAMTVLPWCPHRGLNSFQKGPDSMTHTVCQPCYDCKYTDCVAVCPVECFYQDEKMLYIDPADCIDCEACVPEC